MGKVAMLGNASFRQATYKFISPLRRVGPLWGSLRWLYRHGSPTTRIIEADGLKYVVNPADNGIGQKLALSGCYGPGRSRIIATIVRPGDIVFDVGANIGYYTLQLARAAGPSGTIIAVEPDPRNIEFLKRNIAINRCTNVNVINGAVSSQCGHGRLFRTDSYTDNALVVDRTDGIDGQQLDSIPITVMTLDEIAEARSIDQIHFIKIDIDGSEALALQGMRQTIRKSSRLTVVMEYTPGNLSRYLPAPLEAISKVESLGLRLDSALDNDTGTIVQDRAEILRSLGTLEGAETRDLLFAKP